MKLLNRKFLAMCAALGLVLGIAQAGWAQLVPAVHVFTLNFTKINPNAAATSATQLLNFTSRPRKLLDALYFTNPGDPTTFFKIDPKKGNFSFKKSLLPYLEQTNIVLPTDQDGDVIARQYLANQGWLPAVQSEMQLLHAGGINKGDEENNQQVLIGLLRTFYYGRQLDGMPVLGPGSKITVHIGDQNAIIGVLRRWREPRSSRLLSSTELKSQQQATSEFTEFLNRQFNFADAKNINFTEMAYYDGDGGFIQPVYAFDVILTEGQDRNHYQGLWPAMAAPPELVNVGIDPKAFRSLGDGSVFKASKFPHE